MAHIRLFKQFIGYAFVGLANTVWAYAVFVLFIFLGLHYAIATLIAGVVSVLTGYLAHRRFVFSFQGENRLPHFAIGFMIIYGVNVGIQKLLLASGLSTDAYLNGAVAIPVCAALSFWLNRNIVFRH